LEISVFITSSNANVNVWSYTSTLPYIFKAWCLALVKHRTHLHGVVIMHRDKFAFITSCDGPKVPC